MLTITGGTATAVFYPSVPADLDFDCVDGDIGHIRKGMLEDSTGRSSTTVPSEYISTGVGTGSELVTNGDFETNVDGWTTEADATFTWNGDGTATADATNNANRDTYQALSVEVGRTYVFSIQANSAVGSTTRVRGGNSVAGTDYFDITPTTTPTNYKEVFIATASTIYISFLPNAGVDTVTVADVSTKQIDHGANVDGVSYKTTENGNSRTWILQMKRSYPLFPRTSRNWLNRTGLS
jgi:hypothetical protein